MNDSKKGYVYFFKHIGLDPIKIGYTKNESPMSRFAQFKTYAPYGAEMVGFIESSNAKKLESELHYKYSKNRMKGEWFDISVSCVKGEINTYQQKSNIEEMNEMFENYFEKKNELKTEADIFKRYFSKESTEEKKLMVVVQKKHLTKLFEMTKREIESLAVSENLRYGTHRMGAQTKKGYKLYTSVLGYSNLELGNN